MIDKVEGFTDDKQRLLLIGGYIMKCCQLVNISTEGSTFADGNKLMMNMVLMLNCVFGMG